MVLDRLGEQIKVCQVHNARTDWHTNTLNKRERFKLSVSVFLIIKNQDKILLLKRANTGWMDGYFSIPAGALDGNETLVSATAREAKEEAGIIVNEEDIKLVHTIHYFTNGKEWLGQFFMTEVWQSEPEVKEPEKHSEVKWVNKKSLPNNIIPYAQGSIDNLNNNICYSSYKEN